jgi:hypothetical protein
LTDASSIRLDLIYGMSANRRKGEPFSTEIIIGISGEREDGTTGHARYEIMHPDGQTPVTALAVALSILNVCSDLRAVHPPRRASTSPKVSLMSTSRSTVSRNSVCGLNVTRATDL